MIKYICVLDFEATCWNDREDRSQMEIIEFPSILYKLDNYEIRKVEEFHEYVRPTLNPILSDFCKELTGITQEQVDKSDIFKNVFSRHYQWLKNRVNNLDDVYILTCGSFDLKTQLRRELKNKNIKSCHEVYKRYINIKNEFEYFYKKKISGMPTMLKYLNLELDGRHHSGIDDCRNISKILERLVKDKHIDFEINSN